VEEDDDGRHDYDEDPLMMPEEEEPDVLLAKAFGSLSKVNIFKGTTKESCSAPISVVGSLGVGIELYFRLIRFLAIMFCILTLVNIPV